MDCGLIRLIKNINCDQVGRVLEHVQHFKDVVVFGEHDFLVDEQHFIELIHYWLLGDLSG